MRNQSNCWDFHASVSICLCGFRWRVVTAWWAKGKGRLTKAFQHHHIHRNVFRLIYFAFYFVEILTLHDIHSSVGYFAVVVLDWCPLWKQLWIFLLIRANYHTLCGISQVTCCYQKPNEWVRELWTWLWSWAIWKPIFIQEKNGYIFKVDP